MLLLAALVSLSLVVKPGVPFSRSKCLVYGKTSLRSYHPDNADQESVLFKSRTLQYISNSKERISQLLLNFETAFQIWKGKLWNAVTRDLRTILSLTLYLRQRANEDTKLLLSATTRLAFVQFAGVESRILHYFRIGTSALLTGDQGLNCCCR